MFRKTWFFAALALVACSGGDDDDNQFNACGGDPVAGWDLTTAALDTPDACTGGVSGFIFFNDNGRYSINFDIQAWTKSGETSCGFTAAYGGFYRVDGTQICLGDSSVSGTDIPCQGVPPTTQHAVLDYCVAQNALSLRSADFLQPPSPTTLSLTRRP